VKVDLYYDDNGWQFGVEPETEMEKCALEQLASIPTEQVTILITRLGLFKREVK